MNSGQFKTIFSKRLGCLVAVGEHASSQGKANGAASGQFSGFAGIDWLSTVWQFVGVLTASCALVSLAWAGPVATAALPTGGQVAQGAAAISQSGAVMNITQSTPKAVVNWNTFDIGQNAQVNIVQPSANSVMLNRVTSANPSQILGQLNANGQVVLVNPNGVLFGKDGSVNANSFTASTMGISDANFMAGNQQFERNGSTAAVVNQGRINTTGGYVALLGASVSNEGQINTQGGTAYLAAAETVKIPVSGSGRIKLELSSSRINAAVANAKGGTIVTEGGQVYMQAASLSTMVASIIQSGSIDTTNEQGGAVHLLADGGQIKVDGAITANSTAAGNKGGDIIIGRDTESGLLAKSTDVSGAKLESQGGFVETSAHQLTVEGTTVKAANWLLDPDNIDITGDAIAATAGYSKIKASDIAAALNAGTSVTVATTATNQSNQPVYSDAAGSGAGSAVSGDGNILVNAAIVKTTSTAATLTLSADNGITVNQRIGRASGDTSSNSLTVNMTALGNAATVTNSSGITLNNVIDAGSGNVTLTGTNKNTNGSNRGVTFANNSGITANTITVTGTATGTAEGNQGVFFSGTSSIRATGNGSSMISGTSSSTAGSQNSAVIFNDGSTVTLDGGTGGLTVQGTHTVSGYGGIRFGAYGGSSTNPSLTTRGNVTLGTQDSNNASLNASFMLRNGSITADTGSLTIKGQGTGTGINFYDSYGVIKSNGASIALNGVATSSGHGVLVTSNQIGTLSSGGDVTIIGTSSGNGNSGVNFNGGNVRVFGNNVTINGTANTASGQTGNGFRSVIGPGAGNTITAAGNLSITGAVNGAGSGTAVAHQTTSWQNLVNTYTIGGTLSITGTNNAAAANTSATITMAGVQARAGGNLTVSATTNNAATDAIFIYSANYISGVPAPGYQGGASSLVSTNGNTTIQSNQGSILIQDGVPNSVTSTAITGKNVIIDNTGGTFTGGLFTAGNGTSTKADRAGVQITDSIAGNDLHLASNTTRRTITASDASGQIVLSGKSTSSSASSQGVRIGSTVSFAAPTTSVLGTSTASNGVSTTAAIAASGHIGLTGERTNVTPGVGLNIGAAISTSGTSSTTTLTSTTGAVSGTGNITTVAGNTGTITVNTATAGTLSGVISGGGSLVKQGAGTTTLTGTNTYSGTTTISGGTLQVGSGGTTGSLGTNTGDITNNGTLAFNRSNALTLANAIIGTGALTQSGTGTTTLTGANTYAGTTTISSGTLQIGNGGSTGTLGTGNVTLANGAGLAYNRNVNTVVDNVISGNGSVSATIAGNLDLAKAINLNTTGNTVYLSASGNITQSAGSVTATNLFLNATGGSIGTSANRITSNVSNLALTSAGDQFVTQQDAVNLAARTTGTGTIDVRTTNGTMRVTSVNSVNGVTTTGTAGSITLEGNTTSGHGINISQVITANNGNINLTGSTASTTGGQAGIFSSGAVSAKNINMLATATALTGNVLGYYGAGGTFNAVEVLNLTGQSVNANGLYTFNGGYQSGTSMTLVGTSVNGSGVGMDNNVLVTNNGAGGITITGTASTTRDAIGMGGVAITNTAGDVVLTATTGDIGTSVGNPGAWGGVNRTNTITNSGSGKIEITAGNGSATNTGLINGTVFAITQNANADVVVRTSGTGNVITPRIVNFGTGNVTVAAGTQLAAGTGTGGQVKTVSGNTISHNNVTPGKTYIYTGNATDTGALSNLGVFGADLYLSTIDGNTQNAGSKMAYLSNLSSGSNAQVMFRERLAIQVKGSSVTKTYGDENTTNSDAHVAALRVALKDKISTNNDATLTQVSNSGLLNISRAVLLNDVTLNPTTVAAYSRAGFLNAGNYDFEFSGNDYAVTLKTNEVARVSIGQLALIGAVDASQSVYGSSLVAGTVTLTNKLPLDEVTSVVSIDKTGNTSSSGNLKVGRYTAVQSVTGLKGADSGNYSFVSISKGNYSVSGLAVSADIAAVKTTYGNAVGTGGVQLSGVLSGDSVSADSAVLDSSFYSSSGNLKAGTYVQSVGGGLGGVDGGNYIFSGTTSANYVVNKLALNTQIAGVTTTYGTAAATGAASVSGVLSGDKVDLGNAKATLVDAANSSSGQLKAGTYKQTVANGLSGDDAANYTAAPTSVANYVVTPKAIVATVTAADKVYDGNNVATLTANSADIVVGDVVNVLGATGTFASKNVVRDGSGSAVAQSVTVSGTGVGLGGADGANYTLSNAASIANTTAKITPKDLTVSIADVQTTYGQAAETGRVTLSGVLVGDAVQASAATLSDKSLSGSGQLKAGTYTQTVGTSLSGADAVNYSTAGTSSQNYVVNKLALATSIAEVTTVYGTAAKTGLTSLQGVLAGDKVALPEATLVDAVNSSSGQLRVGTYKQTVANGLSGDDAGNYTALPTSVANYVVTPRAIAATVSVADKVYDGSDVATWTTKFSDILAGDVVKVQGMIGTFASKNVASDGSGNAVAQTVTLAGSGVSLGSTDGANYILSNAANIATTTAKIIPKDLSVTGITASDKVYDGSTTAAINTANAVLSGLVAGDSVNVSTQSAVGNFASKDVAFDGAGAVVSQAVRVSGLSLNGASAVNYTVSDKSGAAAKVLQRALSITGSVAQDKTVDGNTNAQVKPGQLGNLVAGETLVVTATGQFADAEIGTNKAVATQYALANGANGIAKNYTLAGEVLRAAILVASINPVQPIVNPSRTGGGGRVVVAGSSSSGAALGVAESESEVPEEVISREECSVLNPEKCECQESTIAGVEMCFAPTLAANTKN